MKHICCFFVTSTNIMNTRTIQVNFPDSSIRDIEIAVYKTSENQSQFITLYNDRIYNGTVFNHNPLNLTHNVNDVNYDLVNYRFHNARYFSKNDMFVLVAIRQNSYVTFSLNYNPDNNDEIGTYIRANRLFGKCDEYVLK